MDENGLSYNFGKINKLVIIWSIPFSVGIIFLFYLLWSNTVNFAGELNIIQVNFYIPVVLFVISTALHEGLHALAYLVFDNWGFKYLHFGINKNNLNPYCHYSRKLLLWKYIIALLFPGIILGVIPLIIAFIIGNFYLLIYGIVFTLGAIGDFYIVWKLRKYKYNMVVKDHPDMMGCIIEKSEDVRN